MDNLVEINIERLRYLLRLYNLSEEELLSILNKGRKRELQKDDIFTDRIRLSLLKQIDAVFNKGLFYYIDFSPVSVDGQNSIFFENKILEGNLTWKPGGLLIVSNPSRKHLIRMPHYLM